MAVMERRSLLALTSRPALTACVAILASLLVANWWQFEFTPGKIRSLWNPYFIALFGWIGAAAIGFRFYRRSQPSSMEGTVERRTVLIIAGLIGCFLVSLQVMVGMVTQFGSSPISHEPRWLVTNALFAAAPIVAVEFGRAVVLRNLGRYRLTLALIVTSLGLAAIQMPLARFESGGLREQFEFWGSVFIPLAATGLLAGFFALYGGVRAGLLITIPGVLFTYYSPFLPVAPWTAIALAGVAGPAMGLWVTEGLFATEDESEESQAHGPWYKPKLPSIAWVMTAVVALAIFWFSFGFFGFRPAFVPSHSMEPLIYPGDLVLAGPVNADGVRVGEIVLYKLSNSQRVMHRVVAIQQGKDGEREFILKGDNNNTTDMFPVTDDQLMGRYIGRVPRVGWIPLRFQQALRKLL